MTIKKLDYKENFRLFIHLVEWLLNWKYKFSNIFLLYFCRILYISESVMQMLRIVAYHSDSGRGVLLFARFIVVNIDCVD